MSDVAVPMGNGETRWLTEAERARFALKYGPPHRWRDPHPRPGVTRSFDSYVPTAEEVAEADRAAQRREVAESFARVDEELARERATRDRRRYLPRLTEAVVRGMREALLHRACPDRYAATPAAARWLDHCPLVELAEAWLTMRGDPDPRARGRHGLAMALLVRGGVPTWAPASRAHGYLGTPDLAGLLDDVGRALYVHAYNTTTKSFAPWTTTLLVADFRSTAVVAPVWPELLLVTRRPDHGRVVRHLRSARAPDPRHRASNRRRRPRALRPGWLGHRFAQLQGARRVRGRGRERVRDGQDADAVAPCSPPTRR